jgi:hypothetical protein
VKKKANTKPKRDPSTRARTREGLAPSAELYAFYRAQGLSQRHASQMAGYTGARAKGGVTAHYLEKLPEVKDAIKRYVNQHISDSEIKGRIAAMSRGELPTKRIAGKDGRPDRFEFDMLEATRTAAKMAKLLNDRIEHTGEDGGPIEAKVQAMTDAQLVAVLKETLTAAKAS